MRKPARPVWGESGSHASRNLQYWNGYNDPVLDFHDTPIPGTDPLEPSSYMIVEPEVKGWGGPSYYAIDYFASGKGPVLEQLAPFPHVGDERTGEPDAASGRTRRCISPQRRDTCSATRTMRMPSSTGRL